MTNDPDDDMLDDDAAMEEWMSMTDAQQEAEIEREESKYERWYASLTLTQQIRVETRSAMRRIMENRCRLRDPTLCTIEYVVNLWKGSIRRNQVRLVKIRAWRSTGIYPGEA